MIIIIIIIIIIMDGCCQRADIAMEHEDDVDNNCCWCPGNGPQRLGK